VCWRWALAFARSLSHTHTHTHTHHHFNLVIYYGIMSQPWCCRIGLQHLQRPLRRQLVGKVRAICYCNYRAVTPAGTPRHTALDELQPPKPIWRPPASGPNCSRLSWQRVCAVHARIVAHSDARPPAPQVPCAMR
jgi:hypothetical protein